MDLEKHPKCELGHPYVVRLNKETNEKFWGCVFYPEHTSTHNNPYCLNNHPMTKLKSNYGEYFKCRNNDCDSKTYDFEPKDSRYHAQLINLFFRSNNQYKEFEVTDEQVIKSSINNNFSTYRTSYNPYKYIFETVAERERKQNFKEYGIKETNYERTLRKLKDNENKFINVISNQSIEIKDLFHRLWNDPIQKLRFEKITPRTLLDFLNFKSSSVEKTVLHCPYCDKLRALCNEHN